MQTQTNKTVNIQIQLSDGRNMNAELYPDIAPISVQNFVNLITTGFFKGLIFHRVIPGFVIQGGGFSVDKTGLIHKDAPNTIKGEFTANGVQNNLKHTAGVLSMARTNQPNSASSQFFVCVANVNSLDNQYAGFGKLTDAASLQVAIDISKVPTTSVGYYDDVPIKPIVIKDIVLA